MPRALKLASSQAVVAAAASALTRALRLQRLRRL
jgi:mevalonate pyrophosphate decarboxylase